VEPEPDEKLFAKSLAVKLPASSNTKAMVLKILSSELLGAPREHRNITCEKWRLGVYALKIYSGDNGQRTNEDWGDVKVSS
jgi:hypothetical protein